MNFNLNIGEYTLKYFCMHLSICYIKQAFAIS